MSDGFRGTIQHDFDLLTMLRVRDPICYGGALRDFDNGHQPRDYDFIGGLPSDVGFVHGVCRIVGRLSGELADKQITTVTNPVTQTAHLLFNHMGRKIDLRLVSGQVPSVETMAGYGSIGLCSIAADQDRKFYASPRYLDDKAEKTLTIRSGLDTGEYERAVQRVNALQKRYPDFRAVLGRPVSVRGAVVSELSYS